MKPAFKESITEESMGILVDREVIKKVSCLLWSSYPGDVEEARRMLIDILSDNSKVIKGSNPGDDCDRRKFCSREIEKIMQREVDNNLAIIEILDMIMIQEEKNTITIPHPGWAFGDPEIIYTPVYNQARKLRQKLVC
jgi:hypothetical protein